MFHKSVISEFFVLIHLSCDLRICLDFTNKLRVLVTLRIIISAFQHDYPYRNTLFPDSVMSENEGKHTGVEIVTKYLNFFQKSQVVYVT